MDSENLPAKDICRACLKELKNNKFGLFDIKSLKKMFFACTSMEIVEDDVYTKFLCEICYNMIEKFYKFRTMCTESYNKLQNMSKDDLLSDEMTNCIKEELVELNYDQEVDESMECSPKPSKDSVKEETNDRKIETTSEPKNDDNLSEDEKKIEILKPVYRKKPLKLMSCELCPKKFYKESSLHAHMRTHKGLKPYGCNICDKQFNLKESLTVHLEVVHSDSTKLYSCAEPGCDKAYRTKRVLGLHHKKAHLKVPTECVCEECGKVLASRASLSSHLRTHTKELPFKCEKCEKRFTTRHKLKEHVMRHDGIRNFVCTYCGVKKTTKDELNIHINYHTKEKVYKCPHCSSTYSHTSSLNFHIKIVHMQRGKAYSCTYCTKTFAQPVTLAHHTMTHTGEKPFECKACKKRFIQRSGLRTHLKRYTECQMNQGEITKS